MGRLREKLDDDLPELTDRRAGEYDLAALSPYHSVAGDGGVQRRLAGDEEPQRLKKERDLPAHRETGTAAVTPRPSYANRLAASRSPAPASGRRPTAAVRDGLRFDCSALVDWRVLDLSRIPLYLNADAPLACALHVALTLNVARIGIRLAGGR